MRAKKLKALAFILCFIYCFGAFFAPRANALENTDGAVTALSENIEIASRFFELFRGQNKEEKKLAVGGGVFGLRIKEEGVSVTDAKEGSAFKTGDRIIKISGKRAESAAEIEEAVKSSRGLPLEFEIIREGERLNIRVSPQLKDGEYKLGISLRSGASGIGTVSFYDPETGIFGGLGHGVCDSLGNLIPIESGAVTKVILGGIKRGESGKPGELSGALGKLNTGTILTNTECGIFGKLDSFDTEGRELYEIAKKAEIELGKAEIISTVKNGKTERYEIEIKEIKLDEDGSKCFKIKVTDDTLIALTGGIVRGMSGSPIIQNGKLVGAVTHVLVANPTEGYGIFIENMLSAAESSAGQRAA